MAQERAKRRKTAKKARKASGKRGRRKSETRKRSSSKGPTASRISRSRPVKRSWPDVPEDRAFWVRDGRVLRNLEDLHSALKSMDDDTFSHHVNSEKNDFANWIFHVLDDRELAESIRDLKSKSGILRALQSRL